MFFIPLHTDASSHGFGAVLLQKQDDGKFHRVAYFSRTTTPDESRYHSFELETLTITYFIYGLNRFKMYLDGIPFTIVSDCNSLTLTLNKKIINPRISRWALELENYNYQVRHRKGKLMGHVDALSRQPVAAAVDASGVDVKVQILHGRDSGIVEIRGKLEQDEVKEYEMDNGPVFRIGVNDQKQLYGHFGIEKCLNQIKKIYWFPNMREKVERSIRNCLDVHLLLCSCTEE